MKNSFSLIFIITLFISCKTREDIEREKLMGQLDSQMKESQKITADSTAKIQELQEKIGQLTGAIQEGDHSQGQAIDQKITALEEKINIIEEANKAHSEQIESLGQKLDTQSAYVQEVLKTLEKLSKVKKKPKKKKLSSYDNAMALYKKRHYKKAKVELLKLSKNKKIKNYKKARIIHNLGMIEFMNKKYDTAVIYFSRLFTEYAKNGLNKNGLFYLAKSFKALGKKEEQKATLEELIKRFPKDKKAKTAKKLLKSL